MGKVWLFWIPLCYKFLNRIKMCADIRSLNPSLPTYAAAELDIGNEPGLADAASNIYVPVDRLCSFWK